MAVIEGGITSNLAEVDANNQVKVVTSNTPAQVGSFRLKSENDDGSISGTALLVSPETSSDYALRVGLDSLFDLDNFNYAAQNTSKHRISTSTATITYVSNALVTNGSSITTTGTGCQLATYRAFPVGGSSPTYYEQSVAFTAATPTNTNIDFGAMLQAANGTLVPLDGAYFRVNSGGVFGVLNNNGTETASSVFTGFTPAINRSYVFLVAISHDQVQFWVDDVLYATIDKPVNAGNAVLGASLPWGIRHHLTGTASGVIQARVSSYIVHLGDVNSGRNWQSAMAGAAFNAIQGASGHTQGQTANYANTIAPVSATLSNTAAGYTTLGGQFQFAAVAGAETDYALFGYQVPTQTTAITGKNLVITGITIDTFNMGAIVATTPTLLQWSIGVGSTAVALNTAEGAAARAPRRRTLGVQSLPVGAAVGAVAGNTINVRFDGPLVVEPASFVHVILKMPVGTATVSQIVRGVVGICAYWE